MNVGNKITKNMKMREFSHEKLFQICIELLENQRLGSLSPLLTGIERTTKFYGPKKN